MHVECVGKMPNHGKTGIKGFAKRCYGTRRHRLYHRKGEDKSKKSPTAPPPPSPPPQLQTARPYLSRTSKVGGGVQFNVEPVSDDESDGDDYREHTQDVDDEAMRHWIFVQYRGVLLAPDEDEWEDFAGVKGTISLIADAGEGMKDALFSGDK